LVPTIYNQIAFIPTQLPPHVDLQAIQQLVSEADQKLGELRGIGSYLRNPYLLIRPLQNKEAIASSNIEGTYTSFPELLLLDAGVDDRARRTDTIEVFNYVKALQHGFTLLDTIPISNRLIQELHKTLLMGLPKNRAGFFPPGDYRKEQNFIGKIRDISKSRFNPPPPPTHLQCMDDLERFINDPAMADLQPLIFLALVHYQFETIHPFPDGNGRVGRILMSIILKSRDIMPQPLLYMSPYLENNREEYVDLLLKVSQSSDWLSWIKFFLTGVRTSCEKTITTIRKVQELQEKYNGVCHKARSSALLLKIIDEIFERIGITVRRVKELTGTSYTAALHNINKLTEYGILEQHKFSGRENFYYCAELLRLFEE
jgi:Fic family protein